MAFVTAQNGALSDCFIWLSDEGDDKALLEALVQVLAVGAKSLMILACSANEHSPEQLAASLKECPVPVCGGVFPSVFYRSKKLELGFIVVGFPFLISVSCYQQISLLGSHSGQSSLLDDESVDQSRNLIVFVDAASASVEDFINALYENIGGGVGVIGGGAGSLDFKSRPCIFSRAGLLSDAALVVRVPVSMHCAVDHGWQILSGPYLVTEAEGVRLKTINYMPAFEVYKKLLEEITDYRFTEENFFEVSKNFPLGIVGINKDILVRDPVQHVNGELVCVGRIPVNAMIYILCSQPDNLIQAAEKSGKCAAEKVMRKWDGSGLAVAFDCVSRALYLDQHFTQELSAIQRGVGDCQALVGALSIGEIANTAQGTISLFNKSIVVGYL